MKGVSIRNMKFKNSKTARLTEGITPYVSFPVLEQFSFIKHGFSTRLGGVSEGIYGSLNLGFGRGDSNENVISNYERISKSIGVESQSLVMSDQVHKTNLRKVNKDDLGKGIYRAKDYKEIDGLYTDEAGITLVTGYADCVPLYFVDPIRKAIALTHAGWRGTVAKIGPKTVETMMKEYQSKPEDIIVVIGPSICQDCYEVSKDVADEFYKVIDVTQRAEIITPQEEYRKVMFYTNESVEEDSEVKKYDLKEEISEDNKVYEEKSANKKNEDKKVEEEKAVDKKAEDNNLEDTNEQMSKEQKYQLNLWKANRYLLENAGILPEHITIAGVCTCCNADLFHSHRASKGQRGSLSAFLALVEEEER